MENVTPPNNAIETEIDKLRGRALQEIQDSDKHIEFPEQAFGAAMAITEKSIRDKSDAPKTEVLTTNFTAIGVHQETASSLVETLVWKVNAARGHIH